MWREYIRLDGEEKQVMFLKDDVHTTRLESKLFSTAKTATSGVKLSLLVSVRCLVIVHRLRKMWQF